MWLSFLLVTDLKVLYAIVIILPCVYLLLALGFYYCQSLVWLIANQLLKLVFNWVSFLSFKSFIFLFASATSLCFFALTIPLLSIFHNSYTFLIFASMEFPTPNVSVSLQVVGFIGYGSSNGIMDVQGA
jgi:hypothetical protein